MAGEAILIVDDDPSIATFARMVLGSKGYEVRTVTDGAEALAILRTFRPRLVLTDLQMPGMDGFTLLRRLKADPATRSIPVVAVTALVMKDGEQRMREAGFDGYVPKPIDARTLPGVVARLLASGEEPAK